MISEEEKFLIAVQSPIQNILILKKMLIQFSALELISIGEKNPRLVYYPVLEKESIIQNIQAKHTYQCGPLHTIIDHYVADPERNEALISVIGIYVDKILPHISNEEKSLIISRLKYLVDI